MTTRWPLSSRSLVAALAASTAFAACSSDGANTNDTDDATDSTPPLDGSGDAPDTSEDPEADVDATEDSDVGPEPVACSTADPAGLAACVEQARYLADLEELAVARATGTAGSAQVIDTLAARLGELGYTVTLDTSFGQGTNVIGTRAGTSAPDELVVVSAHHDSVPLCAGADDNATGVAGVLELARVLAQTEHDRTLVVALWDAEERGKVGSWSWVDELAASGTPVVMSFVFEMIGYTSQEPDSQQFPAGFELFFREVTDAVDANEGRGDFIAPVANAAAAPHIAAMREHAQTTGLSLIEVSVPDDLIDAAALADLRRSDHDAFWSFGYPAAMITDTANFRYPGYHCADGGDTVDRLDHEFAARTVAATVFAAARALDTETGGMAVTPSTRLRSCDLVSNTGCSEGQKCAMRLQAAGFYALQCVDLVRSPVGEFETCTRPDNVVGEDTCDVGLFCAFWGLPYRDPQNRWCVETCTSNADCGEGEVCTTFDETLPSHGACMTACDPFAADSCGENLHCTGERGGVDGTRPWTCHRFQTARAGEECTPGFDECAAGLACGFAAADGIARCGAPCDETNPCEGDGTCTPVGPAPEGAPTRGVCH